MERNEQVFYDRLSLLSTQPPLISQVKPGEELEISVILRTKDRPRLLQQALTSLANQTVNNFEVVVVNDGGVDVASILQEFAPFFPYHYIKHDTPVGRSAALNAGLRSARHNWCTYLDDDDILYPTHLEQLFQPLKDGNQWQISYSDANKALCWSDRLQDQVIQRSRFIRKEFNRSELLVDNWIPIMTIMHSRETVEKVGFFDEDLEIFEDWDFLIRLSQHYDFCHIPRPTCEYRFRFGNYEDDTTLPNRRSAVEAMMKIHERYTVHSSVLERQRKLALHMAEQVADDIEMIQKSTAPGFERKLRTVTRLGGFSLSKNSFNVKLG
jgi:glycosyltransferase involved in cell wall biosynthesis